MTDAGEPSEGVILRLSQLEGKVLGEYWKVLSGRSKT